MNQQMTADEVVLSVPASLEYVRIVRLATSDMGSRLGFDVDDIENIRIAVDELASTLCDKATGGKLVVTLAAREGEFQITGETEVARDAEIAPDMLTSHILNAVCDKYDLAAHDGVGRFVCIRQLPA